MNETGFLTTFLEKLQAIIASSDLIQISVIGHNLSQFQTQIQLMDYADFSISLLNKLKGRAGELKVVQKQLVTEPKTLLGCSDLTEIFCVIFMVETIKTNYSSFHTFCHGKDVTTRYKVFSDMIWSPILSNHMAKYLLNLTSIVKISNFKYLRSSMPQHLDFPKRTLEKIFVFEK